MRKTLIAVVLILGILSGMWAVAVRAQGAPSFSITPLQLSFGSSEPEIAFNGGFMAITSLSWLLPNGTQLWTGDFGATPNLQGAIDSALKKAGFTVVFGGGDASVDPASPDFSVTDCTAQIIDFAGNDRPWITSDGAHVYISYHDSKNSALIRVQRSEDDGFTWTRVGDAITGAGSTTGSATFNNIAGPIVADPVSHNVYQVFASGEVGILKAKTADYSNTFVSRSTNAGMHWTPILVFAGPLLSTNANVFPVVAVDPTNGNVYATWSNASKSGTNVYFSFSADAGASWSSPVIVNTAPAKTAVFPWVAAQAGTVDVVYYGTAGANAAGAVWNVYLAQTTNNGANCSQRLVSASPNHVGVICTQGTACAPGTRNLLDLFEIGIDPRNGSAAIVYLDLSLHDAIPSNGLPEPGMAQQK